jgi:hypothetical protein
LLPLFVLTGVCLAAVTTLLLLLPLHLLLHWELLLLLRVTRRCPAVPLLLLGPSHLLLQV